MRAGAGGWSNREEETETPFYDKLGNAIKAARKQRKLLVQLG